MDTKMMPYVPKPKLDTRATLKPFDHGSEGKKYILACDSRHWVIAEEFYEILSLLDGTRTLKEIQDTLAKEKQVDVTMQALEMICDQYLADKGLLEGLDSLDETPKTSRKRSTQKQSKYFWMQVPIIPEKILRKMTFLALPFHEKVMTIVAILCMPVLAYLLYLLTQPDFLLSMTELKGMDWLTLLSIMVVSGYLHELGHVGACLKHHMAPGHIGFAFYMTMPVLYADVSRVWNLKGQERALVDIGGIYFEVIFLTTLAVLSRFLGSDVILLASAVRLISLTYNFNPFLKMDGYWLFSDLTGITNLHDVTLDFFKDKILGKFSKTKRGIHKAYYTGLKPKVKKVFYGYVGASTVFFIFFIYLLAVAFITSIENIPVLIVEVFQFKQVMQSQFSWQTFGMGLVEIFKDHALFVLTFILILRMVGKAFSSLTWLFLESLQSE